MLKDVISGQKPGYLMLRSFIAKYEQRRLAIEQAFHTSWMKKFSILQFHGLEFLAYYFRQDS